MRRSRFAEGQIVVVLKQAEAGVPVQDLIRPVKRQRRVKNSGHWARTESYYRYCTRSRPPVESLAVGLLQSVSLLGVASPPDPTMPVTAGLRWRECPKRRLRVPGGQPDGRKQCKMGRSSWNRAARPSTMLA